MKTPELNAITAEERTALTSLAKRVAAHKLAAAQPATTPAPITREALAAVAALLRAAALELAGTRERLESIAHLLKNPTNLTDEYLTALTASLHCSTAIQSAAKLAGTLESQAVRPPPQEPR